MISEKALLHRLRNANPVQVTPVDAPELWLRIIASPGDPRLKEGSDARWRERRGSGQARVRRGAVLACGVLIAACGSATVAKVTGVFDPFSLLAHDRPLRLFQAAPGFDRRTQPAVVPSTVRLVETVGVPRVGKVQFWTARTVNGWACAAFKLPDGIWAGTATQASARYGFGGPVPSCHGPWITWEGPSFHYDAIWLGLNRKPYGLVYGTVRTTTPVARVRDLPSGASARVVDGKDFVIMIPGKHDRIPYLHLQALDRHGHVLARAPVDHITFGP
jgi:hypothetical protein